MKVWRLNSYPKCGGTLFAGEDAYGNFLTCAHCGWHKDLTPGKPITKVADQEADRPGVSDGCNVSPSCFACPLEDCRWEAPSSRRIYQRDLLALELFKRHQHLGVTQAVALAEKKVGVSERSIYRMLKRAAA